MKALIVSLFFSLSFVVFSQEKMEILKEEDGNIVRIYVKNNTNYTQELSLKLTKSEGLRGNKKPVVKKIAPNKKELFFDLTSKGRYKYSTSYSYKRIVTKKEKVALKEKTKAKVLKDVSKIKKGIIVFEKTGCSRCTKTTSYMLDNNIDFKMLNISDNPENKKLMWQLLREDGVSGKITTPVILVDGKLSYNHKDLDGFLKSLKYKK